VIGLNLISMIENVPAQDWESWIDTTKGTILDVREPFEWEQGVLPDATLISMGEIPGRVGELETDQAYLVVCRSGGRSQQVAAFLTMNGFKKVANLNGGMHALGLQD
jgi:rhodanese-related sulfurtransferase